MIEAILVILRARVQVARNALWRGSFGRKLGLVLVLLAMGAGAFGLRWVMQRAISFLTSDRFERTLQQASPNVDGLPTSITPYLSALPSAAFFFALAVLMITGFTSVLSSLYLSGDLDMMLAAPVPARSVFAAKLLEGLMSPYLLLFVFAAPALIGFGQGLGYQPAYYVALPVILLLFPLLPTSIGAVLVLLVLRVVPARRAREIVSVIGALFGALWWIGSQYTRQIASRVAGVETFDGFRRLDNPLLPSAWAGRTLVAAGTGDWQAMLGYGALFLVVALGFSALALVLSERLYFAGWSNMATQGNRKRREPEAASRSTSTVEERFGAGWLPPEIRAILGKDIRLFTRDLRNLQRLIFPLALLGFWAFQFITGGGRGLAGMPGQSSEFSIAGLSFLASTMLSNALAGTGVSREGRAFWLLKLAPISAWRILLGKLALAYLAYPLVGVPLVVLLGVLQQTSPASIVRLATLLLAVGLGATGLQLGFGAAFPRFDWENPQQQTTTRGGCLTSASILAYIALVLGAAFGLPLLAAVFLPDLTQLAYLAGWLLAAAISVAVAWGVLAFGASRLERVQL